MMLFDFQCQHCGKVEERLVRSGDTQQCECGYVMKKLVTGTSFSLKGNGWERDGYGLRTDKKK